MWRKKPPLVLVKMSSTVLPRHLYRCNSNLPSVPPTMNAKMLFFDIETTGLSMKSCRITEVAVFDPSSGKYIESLINPQKVISKRGREGSMHPSMDFAGPNLCEPSYHLCIESITLTSLLLFNMSLPSLSPSSLLHFLFITLLPLINYTCIQPIPPHITKINGITTQM
jgi:DNA polymerase III epsilon subunit-like protein